MQQRTPLAFFVLVFIAGCQTIGPPVTKSFSDDHDSMLVEDLTYTIDKCKTQIVVPKGFVTDYASIPQPLWSIGLSPHGKYSKAAIVHDYLYWSQVCTRAQADKLLLIAMKESGVSSVHQMVIYAGVKLGGGFSWDANQDARKNGYLKVIPQNYWNFPMDVTWDQYRDILHSKGITEPFFAENPPYCKCGDENDVQQNN
jgi:hypothetical protein